MRAYANCVCARPLRGKFKSEVKTIAIFHLSVKTIGRSSGRSAVAAAAYRAGELLVDARTGKRCDYRRKAVDHSQIFGWSGSRSELWNAAETSEKRKNSTVAREFEIALPRDLSPPDRRAIAQRFARELVERHGFAADLAVHDLDGDQPHAHILCTTRRVDTSSGQFLEKTRELDSRKSGEVGFWRERWETLANNVLERAGSDERIDHRSYAARGIDKIPQPKIGAAAHALEMRHVKTVRGDAWRDVRRSNREALERVRAEREAAAEARAEREKQRAARATATDVRAERATAQPAAPAPLGGMMGALSRHGGRLKASPAPAAPTRSAPTAPTWSPGRSVRVRAQCAWSAAKALPRRVIERARLLDIASDLTHSSSKGLRR